MCMKSNGDVLNKNCCTKGDLVIFSSLVDLGLDDLFDLHSYKRKITNYNVQYKITS